MLGLLGGAWVTENGATYQSLTSGYAAVELALCCAAAQELGALPQTPAEVSPLHPDKGFALDPSRCGGGVTFSPILVTPLRAVSLISA